MIAIKDLFHTMPFTSRFCTAKIQFYKSKIHVCKMDSEMVSRVTACSHALYTVVMYCIQ